MHASAMNNGKIFVEKYLSEKSGINILDVGSYDVNGTLKPLFENPGWEYTGLDYSGTPDENVNAFIMADGCFPYEDKSFDVIVSSSCLEHDKAFWKTFSEMIRVAREGGLIYLNVPSEGPYHAHPVDCWRFQKDAYAALSSAFPQAELLESYITPEEQWLDNVGIFRVRHSSSSPGAELTEPTPEPEYNKEFYDIIHEGSLRSAEVVMPLVFKWIHPASVIDVGCGSGAWLSVIRSLGVEKVLGLDGSWAEQVFPLESSVFIPADLNQPIPVDGPFDLAVSLEVAEHLPAERAQGFIEDLVRLSDVVLFSAAVPSQGGINHLNEQWPEFWAAIFERHGYRPLDLVRPEIWQNDEVEWWYRQNIIIFCRESEIPRLFPGLEPDNPADLRRFHEKGQGSSSDYRLLAENRRLFSAEPNEIGSQACHHPGRVNLPVPSGLDTGQDVSAAVFACLKQQIVAAQARYDKSLRARQKAERRVSRLRKQVVRERRRNQDLLDSTSWRLTFPIRWIKDRVKRILLRE